MKFALLILLSVLPGALLAAESGAPANSRSAGNESAATSAAAAAPASSAATRTPPEGAAHAINPDSNAKPAENTAVQLRVNVHAMRVAIEQDEAAEQMAMRATAMLAGLAQDSGSIGTLRGQLNESMAHLDNRCIGVNARNNGGNLILICGDNNGQAQSSLSRTGILVQPAALPPGSSNPAAGTHSALGTSSAADPSPATASPTTNTNSTAATSPGASP